VTLGMFLTDADVGCYRHISAVFSSVLHHYSKNATSFGQPRSGSRCHLVSCDSRNEVGSSHRTVYFLVHP
jgi:hypothetical protein